MQKLRVGIIGCGKIAQNRHAPEYAQNPRCTLAAVYDLDASRARDVAGQYGAKAYASLEEFLDCGLDAVSVCSANRTHADISIRAMNAGLHVLCEKPMAVTKDECARMLAASARTGKRLLTGLSLRMSPAYTLARERITAGDIGRVLSFRAVIGHSGPENWTQQANPWFFDPKISAFGALADLGVHKFDIIHYLLGDAIASVSAVLATLDKTTPDGAPICVDDNAFCLITTKSGVTGTLHASWTMYGMDDSQTVIYGDKGSMYLYTDPEYPFIVRYRDGRAEKQTLGRLSTNDEQNRGDIVNTGVIDEFVSAILDNRPSRLDASETVHAMDAVFAAVTSAREKRAIKV